MAYADTKRKVTGPITKKNKNVSFTDKGREGPIVGIISPKPPWKGRKKLERATGVLEVVLGVLMVILGLMILGVMMVYSPPADLILQLGLYCLFLLVAGFILVWNGRRRLNRKKDYQNKIVL